MAYYSALVLVALAFSGVLSTGDNVQSGSPNAAVFVGGNKPYAHTRNFWLKATYLFSPTTNQWKRLADMNQVRVFLGAAAINSTVYAVGGSDSKDKGDDGPPKWYKTGGGPTKKNMFGWRHQKAEKQKFPYFSHGYRSLALMERYDYTNNTWSYRRSMKQPRKTPGVAALDGLIYVFGGDYRGIVLQDTELYDPSTDQWRALPPMLHAHSEPGSATLNGCVYALDFGPDPGRRGEKYCPSANKWVEIGMPHNVYEKHPGTAVLGGFIYLCGAKGEYDGPPACERYNPMTDKWTQIAPLTFPCRSCTMVAAGDKLYAFRNGQGNAMQRTAAVYNPTANEWTPFGGNPYGCNQGLAAASVHV